MNDLEGAGLPLLDRAGPATEIGFCADCLSTGVPCPDHRDDAATSTANRGNPA